jgi:protein-S-isoprenylcysteine O-methyltransferase Ste14
MALLEELETQGNRLFKYRSYLPIVFLGLGMVVFYFQKVSMNAPVLPEVYWYLCFAVGIIGLLVRIYTVAHTPAGTSGRNTAEGQVAEELNQTGIYSTVRHPLYLGNFLMWLAVVLLTANIWFIVAFILAYYLYYERIMYAEEAFLRRKFGFIYTDWAEKTPAFLPKWSQFQSPKYTFSIRKVLKKEKNGVWALFGLFWIFELIDVYVQWDKFKINYSFWFWGTVLSGLVYFILKFLKYNTQLLNEAGR